MKRLGQEAIQVAGTTIYTAPNGYYAEILDIFVANTGTAATTFSIYLVPSGDSSSTDNALFHDVAIDANTTVHWEGNQWLTVGDSIRADAGVTGVTMTVSGNEVSAKR